MNTHIKKLLILAAAAISAMAFAGCVKPQEQIIPTESCNPWAPEDCPFSRDGYNSPAVLHDYFDYHDSTRMAHNGDTIRFCGWVYYHGQNEPVVNPAEGDILREHYTLENGLVYLVENENHHGWDDAVAVHWTQYSFLQEHPGFVEDFDRLLQKRRNGM